MGEDTGEEPVNNAAEAGDHAELSDPSMAGNPVDAGQVIDSTDTTDFNEPSESHGPADVSDQGEPEESTDSTGPIASTDPAEGVQPQFPTALTFETETLYVDGLIETVKALEAHEARIHALRAFVLSELCEHFRRGARDRFEAAEAPTLTASEVAAALNVSQRTGRAMVEEARALTDPSLAPVMDALREGQLDRRRARAVMEHAAVLPPGKDAAFASAAVELGCPQGDPNQAPSPGAFSRRLRRLAEDYHPEPLAARKAHATAFRRVDMEPTKDGMCWITAHLPLEAGAAIDTRLEAIARSLQTPGEERGIGQLRADVFRDLLLTSALPGWAAGAGSAEGDAASSPIRSCAAGPGTARSAPAETGTAKPAPTETGTARSAPTETGTARSAPTETGTAKPAPTRSDTAGSTSPGIVGGVRMEVVVTVPARTLTGESAAPAEIVGYGPLDAPAARLLAAEAATWTTMWVDPGTGAPLAVGRRRYAPALAIRRFLGARDRTCRFPGCDKPAQSSEIDHTVPWQHGGTTDAANLAVLCREHHRLKSLGHWKLRQLDSDQLEDQIAVPKASRGTGSGGGSGTAGRGECPKDGTSSSQISGLHPEGTEAHRTGAAARSGLQPPPGGVLEWTSPTGRKYVTYPETDAPPPF